MKKNVIFFLCSFFFMFILLAIVCEKISIPDYISYSSGEYKTYSGYLMRKIQKANKPIVFFGSSRTRYHIDINQINGHQGINAGMDGFFYYSWPNLFHRIVLTQPEAVVVSLEANTFFSPPELEPDSKIEAFASFYDLSYLYLRSPNASLYAKYINASADRYLDFVALYNFLKVWVYRGAKELNCIKKGVVHGGDLYACENGGYINSTHTPIYNMRAIDARKGVINPDLASYIKMMQEEAKNNNVKLIIVLTPKLGVKVSIDLKKVMDELGVVVIDLSNFLVTPEDAKYWSTDEGHMNKLGREVYSAALLGKLEKIIPPAGRED